MSTYDSRSSLSIPSRQETTSAARPPRLEAAEFDYVFKLIVIGDSGVGKSCLLLQFADHTFEPGFIATIGVDFKIRTIDLDSKVAKLQIWDTAGQERFRTIVASYYRGADGIVLVFDVNDRESFRSIPMWLNELERYAGPNVAKLLVGNKADMVGKREVHADDIAELCERRGLKYVETSAKTASNVDLAFQSIAVETRRAKYGDAPALRDAEKKKGVLDVKGQPIVGEENSVTCCTIL